MVSDRAQIPRAASPVSVAALSCAERGPSPADGRAAGRFALPPDGQPELLAGPRRAGPFGPGAQPRQPDEIDGLIAAPQMTRAGHPSDRPSPGDPEGRHP